MVNSGTEISARGYWLHKALAVSVISLGDVIVHLDDGICNVEKGSGTSGNQNSGDPGFLVQIPGTFQKRCDGLFFTEDHSLHKSIPNHKIGG